MGRRKGYSVGTGKGMDASEKRWGWETIHAVDTAKELREVRGKATERG